MAGPRQDETRLVTVLFADMSGSVARTQGLDPETALERVNEALDVMARAVVRHGGRVDRYLGDGVLALFGAPQAHEDDPIRAIASALEMRDEARSRGFEVTAGINTGDAYVGRVGSAAHSELTAMGPAVNLAARLQGRCQPGEVLVAATTWRIARRAFEFEARKVVIKGLADPVPAWVAIRARPRLERASGQEGLQTTLVGREHELERLSIAVERARAGVGHSVTVVGEAGVGKSRLVGEIRRFAGEALWLEGRCLESTTATSYAPLLDLLGERFLPEAGAAASAEPIADALKALARGGGLAGDRVEEVLVPFLNLLSIPDSRASEFGDLPPQEVKARTFLAICQYFTALAARELIFVVLDDLHWADGLTLEIVPRLVDALRESTAVLVCVLRPSQEHGSRHLPSLVERHAGGKHVDVTLRPLDERQARRLVLSLLGIEEFPDAALRKILDKAQGNPLFIEEVLRSLLATEQLERRNGGVTVSDQLQVEDVPTTVQSIIQSRVDRIEDEPRRVLQAAAVIGRLFSRSVLNRMVGGEIDVDRGLWHLEQHELVYLDRVVPDEEYSFKHVFTRDTVYKGLLRRHRAELHHSAARALEELYADRLDERVEQLAYHYDRTEDAGRAALFLFRAGEKSRRAYLNEAALKAFRASLARLESIEAVEGDETLRNEDDRRELRARIQESQGDVLELAGRHDDAVEAYEQALANRRDSEHLARGRILRKAGGSRQIQRRREEAMAMFDRAVQALGAPPPSSDPEWDEERSAVELGRIMVLYFTSTAEVLAEQVERSRPIVESRGALFQRALFLHASSLLGLRRERYVASDETVGHARAGYELVHRVEARLEVADIHFGYAFCLLWCGRLQEAESHLLKILAEVERVGHATVQARCVAYLAVIGRKRGDLAAARRWAERTLEVAAAGGMREYVAAAEAHLAWVALRCGKTEEAGPRARRAFEEGRTMGGAYRVLAWITAWPLLGVSLVEGNMDQAIELARHLLAPECQPAPEPIAAALAAAIAAADAGDSERARHSMEEAATLAREPGYL